MKPGLFLGKMENVTYYLLICTYQEGSKIVHLKKYIVFRMKNSKVFEQKGTLLNFKANIDPRAVLSLGLFTFNFLAPYQKENYLKLSLFSFG